MQSKDKKFIDVVVAVFVQLTSDVVVIIYCTYVFVTGFLLSRRNLDQ